MIDNTEDIIDSRDVIARIEELEDTEDTTELEELESLKKIADDCEDSADWEYGEALIRRSYFADYVEEMLKDCGEIPKEIPWYVVIDWEATARNIEQDYNTVDFDGVEYLIRA
jgi:hypothetical protein